MSSISANIASVLYTVTLTQTDFLRDIPAANRVSLAAELEGKAAEYLAHAIDLVECEPSSDILRSVTVRLVERAWSEVEAAEIEAAAEYERQNAPGRYRGEYAFYASV